MKERSARRAAPREGERSQVAEVLNICIVDPSTIWRHTAREILCRELDANGVRACVDEFYAPESMTSDGGCAYYDVVLADISDRQTREQYLRFFRDLRLTSPQTKLIFLSADPLAALDVFECDPDYFVCKLEMETRLSAALRFVLRPCGGELGPCLIVGSRATRHVLDGVTDSACAWVGGKSKIRVILAGIPVNNLNVEATYDGQASKEPLFKNDKTLKDYVQPSGEIEIPISALNIEPYTLTKYRFSCEDSEAEVTVKYDPDAPVLNPEPTYVFTNTSAESRILHFISFGLLFNKQIEFAFDAKDIYRISGSDELQASGIAAVQYSTDDDKSKDSWRDMECERKDGLFHYTCSFDGKFTGSIYVRAIDNVGNVTSPAEVKFDGKSIIISNEGTTVSDDGVLSVYTTTDRNDTEMPYAGDWANNVTFTAITQQDENIF